ncbi:TENX-like protein, partial [Mya arenaria]
MNSSIQSLIGCFANCASCSNSNECASCDSGYYLSSAGECRACTYVGTNCVTCSDETHCNECRPGFWGTTCESFCFDGCNTETCNSFDGACTCKQGFYGHTCKFKCSEKCVTDTCGTNGECECKDGFYGDQCNGNCFSDCEKCSYGTSCSMCPTGRYGELCGLQCECDGRCDILTGDCTIETCPDTCASCRESVQCNGCTVGWYGARCNNTCSANCKGGCEQYSGHCNECFTGYFGTQCDTRCIHCRNGDCTRKGECISCHNGNYGQLCNKTCSEDCLGNTCNQIDGACQLPDQCPGNCVRCTDNVTCTGCKELTVHGPFCNITCSNNCKVGKCSQENGYCTNGCIPNHYGSMCDSICSEYCVNTTAESKCDLFGKCLSGCLNGFIGDTCLLVKGTDNMLAAAIVGAVVGMLVLVVVIVLIVVLKRRRKSKPYEDRSEEIDNEYHSIEPFHGGKQGSTNISTTRLEETSNVSYSHVSDRIILGGGLETATDDDDLEIVSMSLDVANSSFNFIPDLCKLL